MVARRQHGSVAHPHHLAMQRTEPLPCVHDLGLDADGAADGDGAEVGHVEGTGDAGVGPEAGAGDGREGGGCADFGEGTSVSIGEGV